MEHKHFKHFYIAGFSYYDGIKAFKELEIGTELSLKLESDNKYDPHAIEIYYKDFKLGYVPRRENDTLHLLMEMGYSHIFEAYVQAIDPSADPEGQVRVVIYVRKNENA